jgi:hypothetical protein
MDRPAEGLSLSIARLTAIWKRIFLDQLPGYILAVLFWLAMRRCLRCNYTVQYEPGASA